MGRELCCVGGRAGRHGPMDDDQGRERAGWIEEHVYSVVAYTRLGGWGDGQHTALTAGQQRRLRGAARARAPLCCCCAALRLRPRANNTRLAPQPPSSLLRPRGRAPTPRGRRAAARGARAAAGPHAREQVRAPRAGRARAGRVRPRRRQAAPAPAAVLAQPGHVVPQPLRARDPGARG